MDVMAHSDGSAKSSHCFHEADKPPGCDALLLTGSLEAGRMPSRLVRWFIVGKTDVVNGSVSGPVPELCRLASGQAK